MGTQNDMNGVNAMNAHLARVYDDTTFTRSIVESYTFIGFGTVSRYSDGRVDVACGSQTFTNVEVMVIGIDGWGIKPVPAVNDRVLIIASQSPVPDLKQFQASGSMPAYDPSGLKAIPVTDADTAQLITVSKDGIEITGDNKLKINADGIAVEDVKGNKVTMDKNGVSLEDLNGHTIVTSSDGITLTVKDGSTVEIGSSDVTINGNLQILK